MPRAGLERPVHLGRVMARPALPNERSPLTTLAPSSAARTVSGSHRRDLLGWWRGTVVLAALLLGTLAAFLALAVAAHYHPYFEVDLWVTRLLQAGRSPTIDALTQALAWPGFPPQSNILFGTLVLALLLMRQWVAAGGLVLAAGGSAALWYAIAPVVDRPHPSPDLVYVSFVVDAGSFPQRAYPEFDGGIRLRLFLAWTLMPRGWARQLVVLAVPIYLLALGFARIMSGQHWPSDILGGYLIGALWLWVCLSLYRWIQRLRAS